MTDNGQRDHGVEGRGGTDVEETQEEHDEGDKDDCADGNKILGVDLYEGQCDSTPMEFESIQSIVMKMAVESE